jgi:magnesium-transporting ATPase (P-type)
MKTKSENRRALPKFFLTILGAGIFGGVLGFAAGLVNAGSFADGVRQVLAAALTASVPWGIPVTNLIALGIGWGLYAKAKGLYRSWDGEDRTPSMPPRSSSAGRC